jgi:hypothetical protein
MCRLAYLHFDPSVTQERRQKAVRTCLKESWDLGNRDGAGLVTWTPGEEGEPGVVRAIKLKDLKFPEMGTDVLVHARASTNTKSLENTHPFARAGAYLVHNGIVSLGEKDVALQAKATTDNDTELILKAYLGCGRDLAEALPKLSGWANLGIWDSTNGRLILYAHTSPFQVWRQSGVTIICQEGAQTKGLIAGGLGHPYENDTMDKERVVSIPMSAPLTDEQWTEAYRAAVKAGKTVKLAAEFAYPKDSTYACYRSAGTTQKATTRIEGLPNGAGWSINGRLYSNDGTPIDGYGKPIGGKKAAKARRVWAAVRKRAGQSSGNAFAGPVKGPSRGRTYAPVRLCGSLTPGPHNSHGWGSKSGAYWCPGRDEADGDWAGLYGGA